MSKFCKIYSPEFGAEELKAISPVLKSGVLTGGKQVAELEEKFAKYVGATYAVSVNSCTSALFLALSYVKSKAVEIPSVTFVSVANMIERSGHSLFFSDKVYVGAAYKLKGTNIVDSAHDIRWGCHQKGDVTCFSFYPTKMLGGNEGGMIALDNERQYKWLKLARSNGMERKGMFDWNYTVKFPGWKMNMNNIQAAIALVRLDKLDKMNSRRNEIRAVYNSQLCYNNESLHIYPIFVEPSKRKKIAEELLKAGVQTSMHFKPIHLQPAFRLEGEKLPVSEQWGREELSIPLHENMTVKDALRISKLLSKYDLRPNPAGESIQVRP